MARYIDIENIKKLIDLYYKKNGDFITLIEGSLGYGTSMLYGKGLKTCIIQEKFLNAWSSTHTIRFYNKMPKKYKNLFLKVIDI